MAENGTATFANPDDYRAAIEYMTVSIIVTAGGDFKARLTRLNLHNLHALRARESLSRVGFFSLPPAQTFVSFPTNACAFLTYGGIALQFGDVVFHSRGERTHQRTNGEGQWGLISLPPEQLAACSKALTGKSLASPPEGRVLRPPRSAARRLLGHHSKICRLAETQHQLIANPEVARALEQELNSCSCQLPHGRRCRRKSEKAAASYRYHGAVRGYLGRTWRPASEPAGALLGDRRSGANVASVLH